MVNIEIEIYEKLLKELVIEYIESNLTSVALNKDYLTIQVKSKQNHESEWEEAEFRAIYKLTLAEVE